MPIYDGKQLTKFKDKNGGKNHSDVDGFYRDTDGAQFFIKKPVDHKELFTELFAGLLLQEFKERGLIDQIYHPSLICADWIRLDDGSYGLIQPMVAFTELYKIIGTGYRDGSDRNPFTEMLAGPSYYPMLTQKGQYFGLSIALMFSLLLGDYSSHSGNVVCLEKDSKSELKQIITQFARIDWGAAFRYFAYPQNNEDILNPYEYQGWLNLKGLTKGYIQNYRNISGLFPSIANKATSLKAKEVNKDLLMDIVTSALKKIPADLLDHKTQDELAAYMCLPSFKEVRFGENAPAQLFAEEFAKVLNLRLEKIAALEELAPAPDAIMYQSVIVANKPDSVTLIVDPDISFPKLLQNWQEMMLSGQRTFDFSQIDLVELAKQFNYYVELLAHQAEAFNLWQHQDEINENRLAPHYKGHKKIELGDAFVAQYRESTILRRLYTMDPETMGTYRFRPYEESAVLFGKENPTSWKTLKKTLSTVLSDKNSDKKKHANFYWKIMEDTLTAGYTVINTVQQLQKIQRLGDSQLVQELVDQEFKVRLQSFQTTQAALLESLDTAPKTDRTVDFESHFFYSIDDKALFAMNGDQLATISLEELNATHPSSLITRIITNDKLWERMDNSFKTQVEEFRRRKDNALNKIATLRLWQNEFKQFVALSETFKQTKSLQDKEILVNQMRGIFKNLPQCLQTELAETMDCTEATFAEWEKPNIAYIGALKLCEKEADNPMIIGQLEQAFLALPEELKLEHQSSYIGALSTAYQFSLNAIRKAPTLEEKSVAFLTFAKIFTLLPPTLHEAYEQEFAGIQTENQQYLSYKGQFNQFLALSETFNQAKSLQDKELLSNQMLEVFKNLPPYLKAQLEEVKHQAETQLIEWQKSNTYVETLQLFHEKTDKATEIWPLHQTFLALPEALKLQHQKSYNLAFNTAYQFSHSAIMRAPTLEEKSAAFLVFKNIFNALPPDLHKIHTNEFAETQKQNEQYLHYIEALKTVVQARTLGTKIVAISTLKNAYSELPTEVKDAYQGSFTAQLEMQSRYQRLIVNKIADDNLPIDNIDKALQRLQTNNKDSNLETLLDAALTDKTLWDALAKINKKQLSQEQIKDLLTLREFQARKIALNAEKKFGENYNEAINRFYSKALAIRLSDKPVQQQADEMAQSAQQEFQPRHSTRRLIADVLMVIGFLFGGFLVAGGRKAMHKTLFFSSAPTDREQEFVHKWLVNKEPLKEAQDICLLSAPAA